MRIAVPVPLNSDAIAVCFNSGLRFGQGVDKNLDEAMYWYHVAADRADPVAQTTLAYL
jgi:TPR repeat protein